MGGAGRGVGMRKRGPLVTAEGVEERASLGSGVVKDKDGLGCRGLC